MVLRNLVLLTVFLIYFICDLLVYETLRTLNAGKEFSYVSFIGISVGGYIVLHIIVRLLYNCCTEQRREKLTVLADQQYALQQEEKHLKTLRKKQRKGAKDVEGQLTMPAAEAPDEMSAVPKEGAINDEPSITTSKLIN